MSMFKARGRTQRHRPGEMNRTESAYAMVLEARLRAGEILKYEFERLTFRVGIDCRYTPDFYVVLADGSVEFHEVKTRRRDNKILMADDALAKFRTAAQQFPEYGWAMVVHDGRAGFTEHCRY